MPQIRKKSSYDLIEEFRNNLRSKNLPDIQKLWKENEPLLLNFFNSDTINFNGIEPNQQNKYPLSAQKLAEEFKCILSIDIKIAEIIWKKTQLLPKWYNGHLIISNKNGRQNESIIPTQQLIDDFQFINKKSKKITAKMVSPNKCLKEFSLSDKSIHSEKIPENVSMRPPTIRKKRKRQEHIDNSIVIPKPKRGNFSFTKEINQSQMSIEKFTYNKGKSAFISYALFKEAQTLPLTESTKTNSPNTERRNDICPRN